MSSGTLKLSVTASASASVNGPPEATPEDRDPVGPFDGGRELQRGQKRQEPEEDHDPRGDGGEDHDADQHEIPDPHFLEEPRDSGVPRG